jgi:hypothetical protein
VLIYAVKSDFFEKEAFLESVAISSKDETVEKNNELIGKTSASSGI